jgi:sugar/nucleoside kinase (ribokinase family)
LADTDWLVPNEVEFALLSGGGDADDDAALAAFAAATATRLVVTLGPRGAALVGADGTVTRPSARAVDAVDTTGAGDAFVGAFATALADGHVNAGRYHQGQRLIPFNVYDREGEPCPRCSTSIVRIAQAGRSTYFCRICQRR